MRPPPALPRHRRFRAEVATIFKGTKIKLGIDRPSPASRTGTGYHTFATPHLADDEAALFLAMLEAGARALGVILAVDYQLDRGGTSDLAPRAKTILAAVAATRPAPPRLAIAKPVDEYGSLR